MRSADRSTLVRTENAVERERPAPRRDRRRCLGLAVLAVLILAGLALDAAPAAAQFVPLAQGEAVITCFSDFINPSLGSPTTINTAGPVVAFVDVRNPVGQNIPLGVNWAAPEYSQWTAKALGQVFGVTLDDASPPNIFVAASSVYGLFLDPTAATAPFAAGMYGDLKAGGVYRIDGQTGAICDYAKLPNSGPGLGNIAFDSVHRQLLVSNLDDGLVYRLPYTAGACTASPTAPQVAPIDTFDHGVQGRTSPAAPAGLAALADDGLPLDPTNPSAQTGFTPFGRRVWGLQVHAGRLYYSLWNTDQGRLVPNAHNEIWSVAMTGSGAFDASDVRLERSLPYLATTTYSNPVSSISFSPTKNRMLLGERGRIGDYGLTLQGGARDAHYSRVLEYDLSAASSATNPKVFYIGDDLKSTSYPHANSAGGVDYGYSFAGGTTCDDSVWSTGDALHYYGDFNGLDNDLIYGLQGSPQSGNTPNSPYTATSVHASSYYIRLNSGSAPKTKIGDVVVNRQSCLPPPPCLSALNSQLICETDAAGHPTGSYTWTFSLQNLSGQMVSHLYIYPNQAGITVTPSHTVFNPPVGTVPRSVTVHIAGGTAGQTLTFQFAMFTAEIKQCCGAEVSVTLPDCSCAQLLQNVYPSCFPHLPPPYNYSFNLQNLSATMMTHFIVVTPVQSDLVTPVPTTSLTVTPDTFNVSLNQGAQSGLETIAISGPNATPGAQVCFLVNVHDASFNNCCSLPKCFTLPVCRFFPVDWGSLGTAVLDEDAHHLVVGRIGASGTDGTAAPAGQASAVDTAWAPFPPPPAGAFLHLSADATADGASSQALGGVKLTAVAAGVAVSSDLAGSAQRTVAVFDGNRQVASASMGQGAVTTASGWPSGAAALVLPTGGGTNDFAFDLSAGEELGWTLPDGTAAVGDRLRVSAAAPAPSLDALSRFAIQAARIPTISLTDGSAQPLVSASCTPAADRLCLAGDRFAVQVAWTDFTGNSGTGQARTLTADTGLFSFFSPDNVELVVKVIDGSAVNGRWWVFYGALSDVAYTITVTDTRTGLLRVYDNPAGTFASAGDTSAFPAAAGAAAAPAASPSAAAAGCAADALCLAGARFQVRVAWVDPQGGHGSGTAIPLSDGSGAFWFFDAANVELVVKVVDGRPVDGKWWVFYGSLSNVAYTITVTDTTSGAVRTYVNPAGHFGSAGDTTAF